MKRIDNDYGCMLQGEFTTESEAKEYALEVIENLTVEKQHIHITHRDDVTFIYYDDDDYIIEMTVQELGANRFMLDGMIIYRTECTYVL